MIMKNLQKYLNDTLGIQVELQKFQQEDIKGLPLYLRETYLCMQTMLFGKAVILMQQKNSEHFTVEQYRRHAEIFEKAMSRPVILVLNHIESYNRNRMIAKQIAFIIPGQQMFIPKLLIHLKEFSISTPKVSNRFQPATQCLLLFHLLTGSTEKMDLKMLAGKLDYSPTTISRSAKELKEHKLCEITGTKNKYLHFHKEKRNLWEEALPYMSNPVKKKIFTINFEQPLSALRSSYEALSYYTDIAETGESAIAISKDKYSQLKQKIHKLKTEDQESGQTVEIWNYRPQALSSRQFVDPLSLYLIFRDTEDERIEKAIESMVKKLW